MKKRLGFSLIELMVSLFIFTLMLLIVIAMQAMAIKVASKGAYVSVATRQLNNLAQHLLLSNSQDSIDILNEWNKENKLVLPNGRGERRAHVWILYWGNKSQCKEITLGASGCLRMTFAD